MKNKNECGYTLLQILVSLSVMGLMLSGLLKLEYQSVNQLNQNHLRFQNSIKVTTFTPSKLSGKNCKAFSGTNYINVKCVAPDKNISKTLLLVKD